jgi:hypothetical protein
LHDQKVGIVDVQADGLEKVLNRLLLSAVTIDEIFGRATKDDLPGNADSGIFLEPDGRPVLVSVVEDDCDTSFRDSSLTALVDQILQPHN